VAVASHLRLPQLQGQPRESPVPYVVCRDYNPCLEQSLCYNVPVPIIGGDAMSKSICSDRTRFYPGAKDQAVGLGRNAAGIGVYFLDSGVSHDEDVNTWVFAGVTGAAGCR